MPRLLSLLAVAVALQLTRAHSIELPQPIGVEAGRTFPYSMIGQLLFQSGDGFYSGSGTVIHTSTVLTAAHNLYDYRGGSSTDMQFLRGHDNDTDLSVQYASRQYILGGYRASVSRFGENSVRAFAGDVGLIQFNEPAAGGSYAGWSADRSLLTGPAYKIALGYGGEAPHSGEELLYVSPTRPFRVRFGAFLENDTLYFESGMSGGPVFAQNAAGNFFVTGVVVSGSVTRSDEPHAGGMRALDSAVAVFIRRYAR